MDCRSDREDQNTAAQGQQRVEPGGQRDPVNHLLQQVATRQADDNPEAKLLNDMQGKLPVQPKLMMLDHIYQGDSQKHGHRIVTAGLNLQRRADTLVKPLAAQQGEDCRRIRRADNGANQQAFHHV